MIWKYALRRLVAAIPVVIGVTTVTFLLMKVTAGNYVPGLDLNPDLRPEDVARIRHQLGVDQPLYLQYLQWIVGVFLHGDFGRSLLDGTPVLQHILVRLPASLELTLTAILIGVALAIPLGLTGALRRGSKVDHLLTGVSVGGFAVPQFWLGLMLILLFSVTFKAWGLPWLPSGGRESTIGGGDPIDLLTHLVMPATVLSFFYLSIWSRFVRSSTLEVLSQDYVRTARAKGMPERRVVYLHALRNSIVPLVTLVGLELPGLFAGGLVVEVVFSWPGIGLMAFERAKGYDFTMVMGVTTFVAILVVFGNLLADLLYAVLDPRIRYT
ncbi:MAG TPA: ABC transporter permease [Candidatus Dormibacteraeota bacterium]|nr:ABC transporter permease [Candidatus Dormibacteraeota bacterium]